jgi:cell division protein FtsN
MVVGVAVCMVAIYLVDTAPGPDSASTAASGASAEGEDHEGAPRYEFFERLPGAEVATDTEPYKTLTPGGYVEPTEYLVQAGSFRLQDDANRLRARLMLTGVSADISINTLDDEDEVWHQVVVGPFNSKGDAEQTMASLREHDVLPILLQVASPG